MIRTLKTLIFLVLLAGWGLAGSAIYVVRWPGAEAWIGIIPKDRLGIKDTYVDVRNWTLSDLQAHPELLRRLGETGKLHWLTHIAPEKEIKELIGSVPREQ